MCRRPVKSDVKAQGVTLEVHLILQSLSAREVSRIPGVVVKYVDIRWNTGGEGGLLARH